MTYYFERFLKSTERPLTMAILAALSTGAFLFSNNALANIERYDLVLAGGALKTCSSFTENQCKNDVKIDGGKSQLLFKFSQDAKLQWQNSTQFEAMSEELKQAFYSLGVDDYAKLGKKTTARRGFLEALDKAVASASGLEDFTRRIPDPAYYALLDIHEILQTDSNGNRLKERVSVPDNKNLASKAVYQAFVEQARVRVPAESQAQTPHIVVITASSRDHFESADFYEGLFESLNVTVTWLPLSAAWQEAQYLNQYNVEGCALLEHLHAKNNLFNRAAVYPDRVAFEQASCQQPSLVIDAIKHAQGVFFNGGDQSKTLAALLTPDGEPSAALALIYDKVHKGELVVGGTSAGTAVQAGGATNNNPIPMLTNGAPSAAIERGVFAFSAPSVRCSESEACKDTVKSDDVTYRAEGGTGLFRQGLLDTHFSERNREIRLIMTAFATHQRFGFGVDETTALMVRQESDKTYFKVVGERGVFISDLRVHDYRQVSAEGNIMRTIGGLAHFWPTGTRAVLNNQGFEVTWPAKKSTGYVYQDESQWRLSLAQHCKQGRAVSWQYEGVTYMVQANAATDFYQSGRQCGYANLPFVVSR